MSNFKPGSGNLDFGGDDEEDEEAESTAEASEICEERTEDAESTSSEASASSDSPPAEIAGTSDQSASDRSFTTKSSTSDPAAEEYPYFVRRSNVGDERGTRLEIHVRDKIADQEVKFRNKLAEHLGTNEVSKTDAREFALLAAFQNPEQIAELMQDEGFGTLE